MTKYNGYTNYETWLFALTELNTLQEQSQEIQNESDKELTNYNIEDIINNHLDFMIDYSNITDDFFKDAIHNSISKIDIPSLAKMILDEIDYN